MDYSDTYAPNDLNVPNDPNVLNGINDPNDPNELTI